EWRDRRCPDSCGVTNGIRIINGSDSFGWRRVLDGEEKKWGVARRPRLCWTQNALYSGDVSPIGQQGCLAGQINNINPGVGVGLSLIRATVEEHRSAGSVPAENCPNH
ncbi:hypothetical protein, partial [Deinococcus marmoris]|uniref:hypothetical protein n=1 Tax=Deinococcus marmoris TaxID=249408 RepID=UPI001C37C80D